MNYLLQPDPRLCDVSFFPLIGTANYKNVLADKESELTKLTAAAACLLFLADEIEFSEPVSATSLTGYR